MSLISFISSRFNAKSTLPRSIRMMQAVATAGIAVGVAALVVATSIGRGFEGKYRKALLEFNAHVILMGGGEMKDTEEAVAAIRSLSYASPGEMAEAERELRYLPLLGAVRGLASAADALRDRILILLMDSPRLQGLLLQIDPERLAGLLPKSARQKAAAIDEAASRGVIAETPFLYREGLIMGRGNISGVVVKGVDPLTMESVNSMPITLYDGAGSLAEALRAQSAGPPAAIAGESLARSLGAFDNRKIVRMLVPREEVGKDASRRFDEVEIVGRFKSGMHDYDDQFLLMSLPATRGLFGAAAGSSTGIEIKLDDPDKALSVASRLEEKLGPGYRAVTWGELNRELLAAVRLERLVSALIMGVMVVVAALNIVAVLVLMTIYRLHEISVLKALGLDDRKVAALLTRGGARVG
ncbi:MAG TPA: ABC transporter permease, partial [bacterium]|nr:ABC transporter permease [bacterium]